jgi:hypothetical protein
LKKKFWKVTDPVQKEIKGRELLNKRSFRLYPENISLAESIIEVSSTHGVVTFAIVTPRPTSDKLFEYEVPEEEFLPKTYIYLLQRINAFLQNMPELGYGILLFDEEERRENEAKSLKITNFLFKSHQGRSFTSLVPTPFFVDSRTTPGIQIADLFAYCINQKFLGRHECYYLYDRIERLSTDTEIEVEGETYTLKGIKVLK